MDKHELKKRLELIDIRLNSIDDVFLIGIIQDLFQNYRINFG